MRPRADRDFETAMEIVHLVRSFRAVLAAHVLKYRTIEGSGVVEAFAANVELDRIRYSKKFAGLRDPTLADFAKCSEQLINALAAKAIAHAKALGEVEIQDNQQERKR
jgi:hypothetical protein